MGRQINFFMAPADDRAFIEFIQLSGGIILQHRSNMEGPIPFSPTEYVTNVKMITDLDVVHESQLPAVQMQRFRDDLYVVDEELSPVIQFHRSWGNTDSIHRGRIWAQMRPVVWCESTGTELVYEKGPEFARFYDKLSGWIKKNCPRDRELGFYCGPAAKAASLSGTKLTQH